MQQPRQTADQAPMSDGSKPTFLRMPKVVRITGLGRSTIYRLIAKNKFPGPVQIGERAVAWRRIDLEQWSDERPRTNV